MSKVTVTRLKRDNGIEFYVGLKSHLERHSAAHTVFPICATPRAYSSTGGILWVGSPHLEKCACKYLQECTDIEQAIRVSRKHLVAGELLLFDNRGLNPQLYMIERERNT